MWLLISALACTPTDAPAAARSTIRATTSPPEAPALLGDVHLFDDDGRGGVAPTTPMYPALRTSEDGRIGVNVRRAAGLVELSLLGPEGLDAPLPQSPPGPALHLDLVSLDPTRFHEPQSGEQARHFTLCDPDGTNPRPCASDPSRDCYGLTLLATVNAGEGITELWGTPLSIEVADPKTPEASLVRVDAGAPTRGGRFELLDLLEPTTTGDGHLLVARADWTPMEVPDPLGQKQTRTQATNLVYALPADPTAWAPCDVRQWQGFTPLSHLPHDAAAAPYGLARYPFRDPQGAEIPDYAPLGVSYPWIDRPGDNLMFTSIRATLSGPDGPRYRWDCLDGVDCGDLDEEDTTLTRGVGFAGLWTRGKLVLLDGPLNNTDYGLGSALEQQRRLELYEPATGPEPARATGWVRVGTGRANGRDPVPGTTHNSAVIDSLTHRFFHVDAARPVTRRDVVWTVNTGKTSAEIAFDDWLDPDALLIVEMVPALEHTRRGGRNTLRLHDGFSSDDVRLQNAAAPDPARWRPPEFGLGAGVRVEPVALGGRYGRGLWLDHDTSVTFDVPAQPTPVGTVDWTTALFVDPRFEDDGPRDLVVFPDGSGLRLEGLDSLVLLGEGGTPEVEVPLPGRRDGWTHLGVQALASGDVEVWVDGFLLATHAMSGPGLRPLAGTLRLGGGFRGWVDELKVIARALDPEVACNQARGTLVEVGPGASRTWHDLSGRYPRWAHDRIRARLGAPACSRYACFLDADTDPVPHGTTSVREALLFPEGPLVPGQPRPDSSRNPFCLTCHAPGQPPSLAPEALVLDPSLPLEDDPRRQPMQAPARIRGVIPAHLFGPDTPALGLLAPPEGAPLDPWTLAP